MTPPKAATSTEEPAGGPRPGSTGSLVWGLAVTQTVSWGVLYYAFSVLLVPMQRDLGWSRSVLVGGFTVAVIVSGVLAPVVGHRLDTGSPRRVMGWGSVVSTVMVVAWSRVDSPAAYFLVWVGIGATMAMVLYEPAFTVLAKRYAPHHRRAITAVTLVAGLASFIFQPLTSALVTAHGWRPTLLVLAAGLGAATIPLHAALVPADHQLRGRRRARASRRRQERPAELGDGRFWRITMAFAGSVATSSAAAVLLVAYLVDHGWTLGRAAVASGTLGAMQLPGRVLFAPLTARLPRAPLAGALLAAPGVGVLALLASGGTVGVWAAIVVLGVGQGTATLLRATLFVDLYGTERIGVLNGIGATLVIVARALAPLAASVVIAWTGGYRLAFLLFAGVAAGSAVAVYRALAGRRTVSPSPGRGGWHARQPRPRSRSQRLLPGR